MLAILLLNVNFCQPKPRLEPKTKSSCHIVKSASVLVYFGITYIPVSYKSIVRSRETIHGSPVVSKRMQIITGSPIIPF